MSRFVTLTIVAIVLAATGCEEISIGEPPSPPAQQLLPPRTPCDGGRCPWVDPRVQPPRRTQISVHVPVEMRERNYAGGSCVHASTETTLRYQGFVELADWWRRTYSGGEYAAGLEAKLEAAGLRWASTNSGDPAFLEWVSRTRRTAIIFYKPSHSINFVQFRDAGDGQVAVLIDNNHPAAEETVEKQQFLRAWQGFGGFAATIVGAPPPPPPWRRKTL